MIITKSKITTRLARGRLLEGWIERIDLSNGRLHLRTGSRDTIGVCVSVPDECEIHHEGYHLLLQSLQACDSVNITYLVDEQGLRIAQDIEVSG
jgi:hypothetical protein